MFETPLHLLFFWMVLQFFEYMDKEGKLISNVLLLIRWGINHCLLLGIVWVFISLTTLTIWHLKVRGSVRIDSQKRSSSILWSSKLNVPVILILGGNVHPLPLITKLKASLIIWDAKPPPCTIKRHFSRWKLVRPFSNFFLSPFSPNLKTWKSWPDGRRL